MSSSTQSTCCSLSSCSLQKDDAPIRVGDDMNVLRWPPSSVVLASVTFHWPLTRASLLLDEDCVSDTLPAAGFNWRLKFSAKGAQKHLPVEECFASFYIENVEAANGEKGPMASFELGVLNQDFPEQSYWRPCQHAFSPKAADWGFARFIALPDLIDEKRGFVVNDRIILAVRF